MTQEVTKPALEATENDGLTIKRFASFQLSDEYLFSPAPDVATQEEDDELEEIEEEEYEEWDDDEELEDGDDDWGDEDWEDEEVDWDEVDWTEDD